MHCEDFKRLSKKINFPKNIKLIEAVKIMEKELKNESKKSN